MRRTPLKRKTLLRRGAPMRQRASSPRKFGPLKPKSFSQLKRKRIPQKSAKRKLEEYHYNELRKAFLFHNPVCQGCLIDKMTDPSLKVRPSTEIQHKALRGKFYLRTDTWAAVCREHGEKCTVDPKWAYATGMRLTREQIRALP